MRDFIRTREFKYGWILGIAICAWVFVEYLTGSLLGIRELGAVYGLLSEMILAMSIVLLISSSSPSSYWSEFKNSMKMILVASLVVLLFMLPYIWLVNTSLYGVAEAAPGEYATPIYWTIIFGTAIGVILEGTIMALLVCLFRMVFRKSTSTNRKTLISKS